MSHQRLGLLVASLVAATAAAAAPPRITVSGAWTRPAMAGMNAAGYMTITNNSPVADRLSGASSALAAGTSLHESRMIGIISTMRPVAGIVVPPHGSVRLEPNGFHLMLEGLKRPLKPGGRAPLTLEFQRAGAVRTWLDVRAAGSPTPDMKM